MWEIRIAENKKSDRLRHVWIEQYPRYWNIRDTNVERYEDTGNRYKRQESTEEICEL